MIHFSTEVTIMDGKRREVNKMRKETEPSVSSIVKIFQSGFLVRDPSHIQCGGSPCHWPGGGIIGEKLLLRSRRK